MKSNKFFIIALSFFIFSSIFTQAMAADLAVGASGWYAWWKVDYKDDTIQDEEPDPAFLYGPVVSLRLIEKLSLSGRFIIGKFDTRQRYTYTLNTYDGDFEYWKYDLDTALSYSLFRYLKIFAGFKYMGNSEKGTLYRYGFDPGYSKLDHKYKYYGPGSGIEIILPLYEILNLSVSANYLHLWGKFDSSQIYSYSTYSTATSEGDLKGRGVNFTGSLSYYISDLNITLVAGYRYQIIKVKLRATDYYDNGTEAPYNNDFTDTFHGATVSALYFFDFN